jgi:hypothetical protein
VTKISLLIAATLAALLPPQAVGASPRSALPPIGAAEAPLFAAGGTPFSNGIFFPGPILCSPGACHSQPYEIARGTDIRFYNLDSGVVANSHGIVSKDTKNGKPRGPRLFKSDTISGPGSTLMKTSHLKPGTYEYFCTVHFPMQGTLKVVS